MLHKQQQQQKKVIQCGPRLDNLNYTEWKSLTFLREKEEEKIKATFLNCFLFLKN